MNNRFTFKFALLFAMMVTVLGTSSIFAQDWVSFKPDGCYCQFKLPGEEEVESSESDGVTQYKYSAKYGESVYFFACTVHTVPLVDHEMLSQVSLESFAESLNGKIVSEEDWKVKKHTGRKATIQLSDQGASCQYRVVIAGQVQYQIIAIAPMGSYDSKTTEKFFKSVKINQ